MMSARLCSTVAGNPFFQPFDLHVEATDLLIQLFLDCLTLVLLAAAAVAEQRLDAVEELLLPLADLDGRGAIAPVPRISAEFERFMT
jgi:hypothetical protein